MQLSKNEEDYIKALFSLTVESRHKNVGTNRLAEYLNLSPASVNSMLKKLKLKLLVDYQKYGKLQLTDSGKKIALTMLRKHRLWETFLCNHLNFDWDEVHEIAEQLEHINSTKLIDELDKFLDFPKKDPHGANIPRLNENYTPATILKLSEIKKGNICKLIKVEDNSAAFLKYFKKIGLTLNTEIEVVDCFEFDNSFVIKYNAQQETVSNKFAENIFVELLDLN